MEANHPKQTKEQEMIKKIATEFVCPNSHKATTQYERGFVKTLLIFANTLIKEAGYRLPAGKAPLLTDYLIKVAYGELLNDYVLMARLRLVAKTQNDADSKFYGGKE